LSGLGRLLDGLHDSDVRKCREPSGLVERLCGRRDENVLDRLVAGQ
jgi:hypothetical protein